MSQAVKKEWCSDLEQPTGVCDGPGCPMDHQDAELRQVVRPSGDVAVAAEFYQVPFGFAAKFVDDRCAALGIRGATSSWCTARVSAGRRSDVRPRLTS
jgi:hypothetical protein